MSIGARRLQRSSVGSTRYGPVRYASLSAAVAALHAPSDGTYVTWDEAWPNDLEYVMEQYVTGADDILVLPERETPYYIESVNGFMCPSSSTRRAPGFTTTSPTGYSTKNRRVSYISVVTP